MAFWRHPFISFSITPNVGSQPRVTKWTPIALQLKRGLLAPSLDTGMCELYGVESSYGTDESVWIYDEKRTYTSDDELRRTRSITNLITGPRCTVLHPTKNAIFSPWSDSPVNEGGISYILAILECLWLSRIPRVRLLMVYI